MSNRKIGFFIAALALVGLVAAVFWSGRVPAPPRAAPAATLPSALVPAHSPVVGPVDARVTLVEFFDPMCEGCAAFHPIVKSILAEFPQDVRLVYRYLAFHRGSDQAVRLLEAARAQDRFEPVLDALIARHGEWARHGRESIDTAWSIAGDAGLNVDEARVAAAAEEIGGVMERDLADAGAYRIQQTPTVFVDGEPLREYSREELRTKIAERLADPNAPR